MPALIHVMIIPVTPFQQNTSLVWCDATKQAAFVDPGGDIPRLLQGLEQSGATLSKIMLTHGHLDHAGAATELSERFGIPIEGPHREEAFLLDALGDQGKRYGMNTQNVAPTRWLEDGDTVELGAARFDVVHCPGHTPGHVVFVQRESRFAFVGDVLFDGSIGRTDFPRGDYVQLIHSIRAKLFPLGDNIRFVPGHGPISSFGKERAYNPFVSDEALGIEPTAT